VSINKPKISIISLTCCEGCQVAIFDLGEKLLELLKHIDLVDMPLIEDLVEPNHFDVIFIEGAVVSDNDEARLKKARLKSDVLVALGTCACLGGIAEIKNYQDKEKAIRYVYKNIEGIRNANVKPLKEIVKVDYQIPGCPINSEEFLKIATDLVFGKQPKIPQRSVCYECLLKGNECLLQKGLPCLGPIMLAGCDAPCPTSKYPCDGCRGPKFNLNKSAVDNLRKIIIGQGMSEKEINMIFERFGIKNELPQTQK